MRQKSLLASLKRAVQDFDAEDDPNEPAYDPVHLGLTLILVLVAVGALYWMLWTLLVYEGGLFGKILPGFEVLLRLKTAADFGYRGPWDRGLFEGWIGNLGGLVACALAVSALHRLYFKAARRARPPR